MISGIVLVRSRPSRFMVGMRFMDQTYSFEQRVRRRWQPDSYQKHRHKYSPAPHNPIQTAEQPGGKDGSSHGFRKPRTFAPWTT